jgi:alpha-tubulin suppressor-like RCC1 family protein
VQISSAQGYTCALDGLGSVWCWGRNIWQNLGHTSGQDEKCGSGPHPCSPTPAKIVGLSARSISVGWQSACAITTSRQVACWGDNSNGQLGNGSVGGSSANPMVVPNLAGVTQVSVNSGVCALEEDGSVWCWGTSTDGLAIGHQPGTHGDVACNGAGYCTPTPVAVYQADNMTPAFGPGSGPPVLIASWVSEGADSNCAVAGSGEVWCWGSGTSGITGPASSSAHFYPSRWSLPAPASGVSVALEHACLLYDGGGVACWGQDPWGELGVGYTLDDASVGNCTAGVGCLAPTPLLGVDHVVQLAADFSLTLALKSDGTVWAWGINDTDRLAHAPGTQGDQPCVASSLGQDYYCSPVPTRIEGLP